MTNNYVSGLRFQARNQPPEKECRGQCAGDLSKREERNVDRANARECVTYRTRYRDSGICE